MITKCFNKKLGLFLLPIFQGLEGSAMPQGALREMVVVQMHVALEQHVEVLRVRTVMGGQDLFDPPVEALDHPVGLGVAGRNQPMLDGVLGADLVEGMGAGGRPFADRSEAVGELLAVVGQDFLDLHRAGGPQGLEEGLGGGGRLTGADLAENTQRVARSMAT